MAGLSDGGWRVSRGSVEVVWLMLEVGLVEGGYLLGREWGLSA